MSALESILIAVVFPKRSPELIMNGKRKTFACLFLVLTLAFFMIFVIPGFSVYNSFFDYMQNELPPFLISSAGLSIEKPYVFDSSILYLELNNSRNFSAQDLYAFASYPIALICDTSRITLMVFGESARSPYFALRNISFSSQTMVAQKDFVRTLLVAVFIFMYFFFFVGSFIAAILYSIVGVLFNRIFRAGLSYGDIYKLSLYALFLPLILQGILALRSYLLFLFIGSRLYIPLVLIMLGVYIFYLRTPKKPSSDTDEDDEEKKPPVIRI